MIIMIIHKFDIIFIIMYVILIYIKNNTNILGYEISMLIIIIIMDVLTSQLKIFYNYHPNVISNIHLNILIIIIIFLIIIYILDVIFIMIIIIFLIIICS